MSKHILILFLISTHFTLFAQENLIKARAKQNDKIIEVKAILRSPMRSEEREIYSDSFGKVLQSKKILPVDFIKHIKAIQGKEIVFDLATSIYYAGNSIIKFKYKKPNNANMINFLITDHQDKTSKLNIKIKKSVPLETIVKNSSYIPIATKYNPDIWKAKSAQEVINKLSKATTKVQHEHLLTMRTLPKEIFDTLGQDTTYIQDDTHAVIHIKSDIQLQSIAILSNRNKYALAALMTIPDNAIIDYRLAIKTGAGCCEGEAIITVVAKGIDGTIYRDNSLPLRVACSTTDGSCY